MHTTQSIKLNSDQTAALNSIKDFLKDKNRKVFSLTGPPGSGKTFLLGVLVDSIAANSVLIAAPSHTAVSMLENAFKYTRSLGTEIKTVASALGLQYNADLSDIRFLPNKSKYIPIKHVRLFIIDEVSMINDEYHDLILNSMPENSKIIAVGDRAQLPPVGQNTDSKFFDYDGYDLKSIVRFGENIRSLSEILRSEIVSINNGYQPDRWVINKYTNRESKINDRGEGYIFETDIDDMLSNIARDVLVSKDNRNYVRVLAYKNKSVDEINLKIRNLVYGDNLPMYIPNEILISESTLRVGGVLKLYNKQVIKARRITEIVGPYDIPCFAIETSTGNTVVTPIRDYEGNLCPEYLTKLGQLKSAALRSRNWNAYHKFVGTFAWFSYGYSTNTHKAQGGTFENVYVFEDEIMNVKPLTWKEKFQSLYVAITRASKKLHIYNAQFT